ncbi:MAG: hypothetical protein NZM18_04160 [Thermoflexales bacterium]|nr:hypothetical protein [Thermoflexales bacterium]MDW8351857.1 hypothetical protein [Anaerolineae bacterium]
MTVEEKTRSGTAVVASADDVPQAHSGLASADSAGHRHAEPHMPAPSLSPIILAAGMTLAAFGIVLHPIMLALGIVGILVGLGTWLYDEIVNASSATADHE